MLSHSKTIATNKPVSTLKLLFNLCYTCIIIPRLRDEWATSNQHSEQVFRLAAAGFLLELLLGLRQTSSSEVRTTYPAFTCNNVGSVVEERCHFKYCEWSMNYNYLICNGHCTDCFLNLLSSIINKIPNLNFRPQLQIFTEISQAAGCIQNTAPMNTLWGVQFLNK